MIKTGTKLFFCAVPFISAISCILILFMSYRNNTMQMEFRLKNILQFNLLSLTFTWFSVLCYHFFQTVFVYIIPFYYLFAIYTQISLYHLIYNLTLEKENKKLPFLHYFPPLLLCIWLLIWSLNIPLGIRMDLVENKNIIVLPEYINYSIFLGSMQILCFAYTLLYVSLIIHRISAYYIKIKAVNKFKWKYSGWLIIVAILATILLLNSIIFISFRPNYAIYSFFYFFSVLVLITQMLLTVFNIIKRNYILLFLHNNDISLYDNHLLKKTIYTSNSNSQYARGTISLKEFEDKFLNNKMYTNPELKITDLVVLFKTNRTYLSAFINCTYSMSFKEYINSCRLKEVEELKKLSSDESIANIVIKAGFGSYRSYLRSKKKLQDKGWNL